MVSEDIAKRFALLDQVAHSASSSSIHKELAVLLLKELHGVTPQNSLKYQALTTFHRLRLVLQLRLPLNAKEPRSRDPIVDPARAVAFREDPAKANVTIGLKDLCHLRPHPEQLVQSQQVAAGTIDDRTSALRLQQWSRRSSMNRR